MPGHSSFGRGMPEITIAACGGALDPTLDATYTFLSRFLAEMGTIFPDPYLALGGDEVSYGCAAGVKRVWLAAHNMTAAGLLPHFWRRVTAEVLPRLNRTLYVWGTGTLSNLDPSTVPLGTVFNLYTNLAASLNATARRGVPGILSAPYYLDQTQGYRMGPGEAAGEAAAGVQGSARARGQPQPQPQPQADPEGRECGAGIHHINSLWQCFYSASPADGVADAALAGNTSLVMGGEACIWGEGTSHLTIEEQTLTLASAVAERLWSGAAFPRQPPTWAATATPELEGAARAAPGTEDRLAAHVCLLNRMGLRASPIRPGFCLLPAE